MNDKLDELAKTMALGPTRRAALKNFGLGVLGIALARIGLVNNAEAQGGKCTEWQCLEKFTGQWSTYYVCGGKEPSLGHCHKVGFVNCGFCPGCC